MADKENVAPLTSDDPLSRKRTSMSPRKTSRKGRSKSIGPGALEEPEAKPPRLSAKDRRKSAFVPATKSILSKNEESERAARRKSMANRRVSFAPEATLHTWDVIFDQHEHTTSTDSADSTRRASELSRSSSSPAPLPDHAQEEEDEELLSESESGQKSSRRSSGIPPMNFNNPEDVYSSSDMSGSDDSEGEDEDPDADGVSDDETGTAMSLDVDEGTLQSVAASEDGSTSSSGRLDATLREASQRAGTRGIEFDEFGDMSMEVAEDEITSAMQPWVQKNILERIGSAEMDQENVNPFSPAFQNGVGTHLTDDGQDSEEDMSMDVTRAVGGIMKAHSQSSPMSEGDGTMDVTRAVGGIMKARPQSSPTSEGDGTMDLTQAVGKITGQKRRRSTTDAGSPGAIMNGTQSKRRRSSMARSSMGEDTMDLTVAMGGIKSIPERRKSLRSRRSSGMVSDASDMTMDMTKAVGGIQKPAPPADVDESFDYNEELSMELTTVLGGINKAANPTITEETESNITPKDHGRFKDAPDLGAKQLLTPILQKEVRGSVEKEKSPSPSKSPRLSQSPVRKQTLLNSSPLKNSHTLTANPSPRESTAINNDDYPELPPLERDPSPIRTPTSSPKRRTSRRNLGSEQPQFEAPIERQQRSSPVKGAARTPEKLNKSQDDSRNIHENIKLMSTPRKETLKNVTPKKQMSPVKPQTPRGRPTPRGSGTVLPSPVRQLSEDLQRIRMDEQQGESIGLQDFLVKARIRFMDLTTTKRRMTTNVPAVRPKSSQEFTSEETTLENAIVAGACTIPELELYQHACHELKRFAKEGKQVIDELEEQTAREQPPLIQAYVHAPPHRKLVLDAQMRDMKTNARLRSKEMWYAWRSQLLEELMMGLGKIGEGLIQDDETISRLEEVVEQELPPLIQRHGQLQQECAELEQGVSATSEDEKKQLDEARHGLTTVNIDLAEKRRLLESLRAQVKEQDSMADHLQASKVEFTAAIQEANRVREACRGVSLEEITALKESVRNLEQTTNWSISSASSNPSTLTMLYKSSLQFFFHPKAFGPRADSLDAPISLSYIANPSTGPLTTTLRFFLQFLRAALQALPRQSTRISSLLKLISSSWDTALLISESERRLRLETLTTSEIKGDERLDIVSEILLRDVKTKVQASLELEAKIIGDGKELRMGVDVAPNVRVVYGEEYNEKNMTEYLKGLVDGELQGWDAAVRQMKTKLIARGAKGARK